MIYCRQGMIKVRNVNTKEEWRWSYPLVYENYVSFRAIFWKIFVASLTFTGLLLISTAASIHAKASMMVLPALLYPIRKKIDFKFSVFLLENVGCITSAKAELYIQGYKRVYPWFGNYVHASHSSSRSNNNFGIIFILAVFFGDFFHFCGPYCTSEPR